MVYKEVQLRFLEVCHFKSPISLSIKPMAPKVSAGKIGLLGLVLGWIGRRQQV
ncbi:hypothetical protein HanPSC8_Chr16g0697321 [Helianthus annuus]|nr:hypothetical protein HanPSC8_Chr16g0697321 [Helianthus annuus]